MSHGKGNQSRLTARPVGDRAPLSSCRMQKRVSGIVAMCGWFSGIRATWRILETRQAVLTRPGNGLESAIVSVGDVREV